ncbi:MAG: FtsQ-type POTRA domain-containing protein [Pseudomonadota bacterium]
MARWLPVCAALASGAVFLSWTDGGRTTRLSDPLTIQLDRLADGLGLGLQEITVGGHRRTREKAVYAAMQLRDVRSFVLFDSEATRRRIEDLPWVARAEIRRSFPWRVAVRIVERRPFALWRHQGVDTIVDRTGRHLETVDFGRVRSLPLVAGLGAEAFAHEIVDAVAKWPDLVLATSLAKRIGRRRWDLVLSGSRRVQLPERDFAHALRRLMAGQRGQRLFDRSYAEADLRVPGQITLRSQAIPGSRYNLPRPVLSRTIALPKVSNRG